MDPRLIDGRIGWDGRDGIRLQRVIEIECDVIALAIDLPRPRRGRGRSKGDASKVE